ncbi:MAG: hypothetical protein JHC87_02435 [Thermoleophilaceae bacterium]|nr:hypothetical protein [Thermoleophilaceae bacterium]
MHATDTKASLPGTNRLRARTIAGRVLIGLAGIALVGSILTGYAQRNIFDSARFADHATATFNSSAVRQVSAEALTRQVIAQVQPDAVGIKPLIDSAAASVMDTAAFRRLFRTAALQVHEATIEQDLDGAALVVANVGVLISQALRTLSPELASQIPAGLDASLVQAAQGGIATDAAQFAHRNQSLAWFLPLLALALFAAGVAITPDRRKAVISCGLAVFGAGAFIAAAYLVGRWALVGSVGDGPGVEQDAAREIWAGFMRGLLVLAVIVGVAGAAIAAAADGALHTAGFDRRVRELVTIAVRPPVNSFRRVVWSLVLIGVGFLALADPIEVLKLLAGLTGAYLVFRGLNELITVVIPASSVQVGSDGALQQAARIEQRKKRRVRIALASIAGVLAVGFVGTLFVSNDGLETLGIVITNPRDCNGSPSLCDKRYNEVLYATTHNSMSDLTFRGWLFGEQDGPISEQLGSGVRGLMLDVYYGFPGTRVYTDADRSSPGARDQMEEEFGAEFVDAADSIRRTISKPKNTAPELFLCHGFCELGALEFDEAMAQIKRFLVNNPRDVLTIVMQDYVPPSSLAAAFEKTGIADHVYRGPVTEPWPTLREMIDDDQRVVVMLENGKPTVPWMHRAYEVMQETPFKFQTIDSLRSVRSCDPLRGEPENSVFLMNHWINTAPAARPSNAAIVNRRNFMKDRIERCEKLRKHKANLVAVDFFKQGDLMQVVDEMNAAD